MWLWFSTNLICFTFTNTYRSTSSNILTATYGWPRITEEHVALARQIHALARRLASACVPGASMVDLFPVLNYLPVWMAKWKRDALEWHERESKMFEGFYTDVNKKMVSIRHEDLLVRRAILSYISDRRAGEEVLCILFN